MENKLSRLLAMSNNRIKVHFIKKKSETVEIENAIVKWILMNSLLGVSIGSWEVIIKVCSLNTELKQKYRNTQ